MDNQRVLSWEEYRRDVADFAEILKKDLLSNYMQRFLPYITGVPRGGLIIAVSLSHLLDLHFVAYPYTHIDGGGHDLIICDDIFSTGKTFENDLIHVFNKTRTYDFGNRITLALYRDNQCLGLQPSYCFKTVEEWLIFPWETKKSSRLDRARVTDSV